MLDRYSQQDGIPTKDVPLFFDLFKDKNYCILIFLKNPVSVKPFRIDKEGYGAMASWLCLKSVADVRKP